MKVLTITLLLMLTGACHGIRCYECGQAPQFRCAHLVEVQKNVCPDLLVDEEEAHNNGIKAVCIKTTVTNKNPNITDLYINRQCGRVGPGRENSCSYFRAQSREMSCYSCDSDLCNGSNTYSVGILILIACSIGVMFSQ